MAILTPQFALVIQPGSRATNRIPEVDLISRVATPVMRPR